ncbi:MAG: agmatinase [Halobacteriovoraceae bacterium]|nr:agmatinase [Halobacteriovoraceae bacterium]
MIKKIDKLEASKSFLGTKLSDEIHSNATHIIGFCFDGTTSYRPGARFGPDGTRDGSFGIESYSPYLDRELEDYSIYDCQNLPIFSSQWKRMNDNFHELTKDLKLKEDKIKFLTLGGEHSISYGPIRLCLDNYEDLFILHLDAHTDLRDGYLDEKYSHASIIRRIWDHMDEKNSLLQYGIRSGLKEEFEFMKNHNTQAKSLAECVERLQAIPNDRPVYLTLDLDFFDPAFLPGTGTPEAGGEDFHGFVKIIKTLKEKNFVGADIVELAPKLDASGISEAFAAKVTREVLLAMQD